jgi:hypothetical protein
MKWAFHGLIFTPKTYFLVAWIKLRLSYEERVRALQIVAATLRCLPHVPPMRPDVAVEDRGAIHGRKTQ